MMRDKYAVGLAQEQREELQRLITGWEKFSPSDRQGADSANERGGWAAPQVAEALDVALTP